MNKIIALLSGLLLVGMPVAQAQQPTPAPTRAVQATVYVNATNAVALSAADSSITSRLVINQSTNTIYLGLGFTPTTSSPFSIAAGSTNVFNAANTTFGGYGGLLSAIGGRDVSNAVYVLDIKR